MTAADEIIADLPLDRLAQQLGTDPATAEEAVRAALPTLFGGLQTNVTADDDGARSLAEALGQHSDPQFFAGGIDLDAVDTADGQAIVRHMFANSPDSAQVLQARAGGVGGDLLARLLPILAPIVMSYIAKKLGMGGPAQQPQQPGAGGGLGDLLGPILGGMLGGGGGAGSMGGGFGDILGQILAGQQPAARQPSTAQPSGGEPWPQPRFNTPDDGRGDDGRDDGGIGDVLGGLFGR